MRSRLDRLAPATALLLALAAGSGRATEPPRAPLQPAPVDAVMQPLQADPLISGTERQRWRRFKADRPSQPPDPPSGNWFEDLMRWLASASRYLMWLGFFAAAALVLVWLPRWWRYFSGQTGGLAPLPEAPSHVRALDIRPDSLPEDIGAAAAALWQRGEAAAALSLLYRGALSRLVHVHRVPIRAASTEGECLALARPRLPAAAADYVAQLVGLWQRAVYAGQRPASAEVLALCEGFAAQLPATAPAATEPVR